MQKVTLTVNLNTIRLKYQILQKNCNAMQKIVKTRCKKFHVKIPYRYREIVKNNVSLTYDVNEHIYFKSDKIRLT